MDDSESIALEQEEGSVSSSLYSDDLAPVPESKRTWNTWNYAALWISMSLCIPTYMLASSLIEGGMNCAGYTYNFSLKYHCPGSMILMIAGAK
jgi:cytosine/uracil/thiamine/allantoin permease